MVRELEVSDRRFLLARPQRLGFLPTMWFWNDWGTQRLLVPFALMSAPFLLLLNVLQLWLRLSAWIPITVGLVVPYLTMGLVERYVRAQVRLPSRETVADVRPIIAQGVRAGRALMFSMAAVCGVLAVLVLLRVTLPALGAAAVGGLALVIITLRASRSRARSLASTADVAAGEAQLPSGSDDGAPPRAS